LILDPCTYPNWDDILAATPGATFFHTAAWAKVLAESYDYKPVYLADNKNNELAALCAMMDVRSRLTGCRGVSLPFTDYCEPIASDPQQFQEMLNEAIMFGKKQSWKYLEFRGGERFFQNVEPSAWFYGHTLDLAADHQAILKRMRDSTRRNIKKAEKENITIAISNSLAALDDFYRLNTQTRRDHGLPPQPYRFFERLYDYVLAKNMGFIILAHFQNQAIAANVYFHFGDQLIYKYGASNKACQHRRANNLIMWEAVKWGCDNGCKSLCFGRTEPDNEGLRHFKNGWGAKECKIRYYRYDLQKKAFITRGQTINSVYNKLLNKTPLPILKILGKIMYRHMG
jgi:hypothetical protein